MPPAESGEAAEVPIRRDQQAPNFDGECCQVRIRNHVAPHARFQAEPLEDLPMPVGRRNGDGERLIPYGIGEFERALHGVWWIEHARMRHDAHEAAEDELRDSNRFIPGEGALQPVAVATVIGRRLAKGIYEDVDVRNYQLTFPSMRSRRATPSSRSTPGRSRPPRETGSSGALRRG